MTNTFESRVQVNGAPSDEHLAGLMKITTNQDVASGSEAAEPVTKRRKTTRITAVVAAAAAATAAAAMAAAPGAAASAGGDATAAATAAATAGIADAEAAKTLKRKQQAAWRDVVNTSSKLETVSLELQRVPFASDLLNKIAASKAAISDLYKAAQGQALPPDDLATEVGNAKTLITAAKHMLRL